MALLLTASRPPRCSGRRQSRSRTQRRCSPVPACGPTGPSWTAKFPVFSNEDLDRAADQGISHLLRSPDNLEVTDDQRDPCRGADPSRSGALDDRHRLVPPPTRRKGTTSRPARAALSLGIDGYALDIEHREERLRNETPNSISSKATCETFFPTAFRWCRGHPAGPHRTRSPQVVGRDLPLCRDRQRFRCCL